MPLPESESRPDTWDDLLDNTLDRIARAKLGGAELHYVAGVISGQGDDRIAENIARLEAHRQAIQTRLGGSAIVFTSPTIFTPDTFDRLGVFSLPRDLREIRMRAFWDSVLEAGHIDAVHFTPGWTESPGAKREHEMALRLGIAVHYVVAL